VENQQLGQEEINAMNEVKQLGVELGVLVKRLKSKGAALDQRWVSEGATDLQKGLMSLTRSIAKPDFF